MPIQQTYLYSEYTVMYSCTLYNPTLILCFEKIATEALCAVDFRISIFSAE